MTDALQGLSIASIDAATAARFFDKTIPEPNSGCLIWLGASSRSGYGSFWADGRPLKAHRTAYAIEHGGLKAGLDVMHRCDTPHCVNHRHLRAVPTADNIRDAFQKGRLHRRGDKNSQAKIPDAMIPVIRRLFEAGVETSQIAFAFQVNQSTVRKCLTNQRRIA